MESAEQSYCERVIQGLPDAVNLIDRLTLPALGCLLSHAALYVGTDTAVSHMAAAVGTPTVVLFGPSNPVKWGPWPKDFPTTAQGPWRRQGSQRQGETYFFSREKGNVCRCLGEGCDRHIKSLSECLQQLPANRVIQAVETMLVESKAYV